MVRSALLKAIYDVLSSHLYLAVEDFKIEEYANSDGQPCLRISYRYDQNWHFRFLIPQKKKKLSGNDSWERYWFLCTMSPGRESVEETLNAEERQGLLTEIGEWVKRLYEDIVSMPVVRQFEAHTSALEQLKERLEQLPDELISRDEAQEFREGLDQIKADFSEKLSR